jgi:hypothetical protein
VEALFVASESDTILQSVDGVGKFEAFRRDPITLPLTPFFGPVREWEPDDGREMQLNTICSGLRINRAPAVASFRQKLFFALIRSRALAGNLLRKVHACPPKVARKVCEVQAKKFSIEFFENGVSKTTAKCSI